MVKINYKKVIDIALKKKKCVIAIILIFIITGCVYTFGIEKELYESSTTFLLGVPTAVTETQSDTESTTPVVRTSLRIDTQTIATYNEIVKSDTSINAIKNNLKLNIDNNNLKKAITVTRAQKSDVIKISVRYTDRQIASEIANETVKVFSEKIKEIYKISEIYIIDAAIPADNPYNVHHVGDIILVVILGILVSFVYCIIISVFDKTIKSYETIEDEIGLKVLASIPNKKSKKQSLEKLIDFQKEKSPVIEGFEKLKMNVQFTNIYNKNNKVMLVTSPLSIEGKSYVASNLAAVFAKAGKKVIVIDMDMRAGRQASIFGVPNNLGISNYLSNIDTNGIEINERINSYIKETSIKNLNVITSGSVPPNTSDLLTSQKLPELIKDLSVFYDLIVFDGAPVLPVADSLILTKLAGSTILVTLANKTKKENLKKAKKDLQSIGGRIIGVVLNEASSQNKIVKKAYLKLEERKLQERQEKNKKKYDIKNKVQKMKKWILNHIVFYKKKGEQLLLGQKREMVEILTEVSLNKTEKQDKQKENTIKIEEKKEEAQKGDTTKVQEVADLKKQFDTKNQKEEINLKKENIVKIQEEEKVAKVEEKKIKAEQIQEKAMEENQESKIENNDALKENIEIKVEDKKEFLKKITNGIKKINRKIHISFRKRRKRREKILSDKAQEKVEKQEEARIQEELLEDNLYPKTKDNKNL